MKKKIFAFSLLVVCLSLCISGTLAYFTASRTARNVITTGNIKIELNETGADGKPFKNASGVLPGAQIKKIVTVKNVSDNACWVRLAVNKAISLAEGVSTAPDLSLVSLDINREDWCERDGFYYYKHPLEAGQTTVPLFTTVSFDTAMDDSYKRGTAEITVRAQAVQYANNGASALNAVGWREE